MRMAGHRIPDTARLKLRHPHNKLTALHLSRQDVLTDHSVVGILQRSQFHFVFILHDHHPVFRRPFRFDQHRRITFMGGCTIQIKFCRLFFLLTFKYDFFHAHTDVHTFLVADRICFAVCENPSRRADIDHAHLSSL